MHGIADLDMVYDVDRGALFFLFGHPLNWPSAVVFCV